MPRIAPDSHDDIVWLCSDAASPIVNTGTTGAANNLNLGVISGLGAVLGDQGVYSDALRFLGEQAGTGQRRYANGANGYKPPFPLTLSGWYYLRKHLVGENAHFLYRTYNADAAWGPPYMQIQLSTLGSQDGNWYAGVSTAATDSGVSNATHNLLPLNQWFHIGMSYDGSNIRAYLNGRFCGSAVKTGVIDYQANDSKWAIGATYPTSGSAFLEEGYFAAHDVRIANIARPLSYFQNVYANGALPVQQIGQQTIYKLMGFTGLTPSIWTSQYPDYSEAPLSGLTDLTVLDARVF